MAIETQDTQKKADVSSGVPEKSPFDGDAMDRWAEQVDLFKDESKSPAKAKEALKEAKPCENCPDGDEETTPTKTGPKTVAQEKTTPRQPFKVLKDSSGKEFPVYSQQEYDELALKGATGLKQAGADSKVAQFEDRLANAMLQLERIETYARGPSPTGVPEKPAEEAPKEEEIDLDTIDDPAVRTSLKKLKQENVDLRKQVGTTIEATRQVKVKELAGVLDQIVTKATEENPFEPIRFEENGPNFSEEIFAGLLQQKVSKDKLEGKPLRGIDQYITDSIKDLHRIEKYYQGKYTPANSGTEGMTAEMVVSKYPQIAEEIGQKAVADWQRKIEEAPPVAKSRSEDILHRREPGGDKKPFLNIEDALNKGFSNPEIADALEEASKKSRAF